MGVSVYDYVASVHDYGQVVVASEGIRDVVLGGDVCRGGGYASVRIDVDVFFLLRFCRLNARSG